MIHAMRNGLGWIDPPRHLVDCTNGRMGIADAAMDEIWRAVPAGRPVEIQP